MILWNQNFTEGYSHQFIRMIADLSSDKFGPYILEKSPVLEQGRAIKELQKGIHLNIAVMGNEAEREYQNPPIYFPVDRGALGLRVCFIAKGKQALFDGIRNAADARKNNIVFGSGTYWPDKEIFESNGFSVLSSPVFDNLFNSLYKDRFDCLTRAVSEVTKDLERYGDENIDIEQRLAFVYPLANFIYLAPQPRLRARMEYGIERAKETGQLEALASQYLEKDLVKNQFFKRRMIILQNPNLTEKAREAINQYGFIAFEKSTQPIQ
jgi:ABC-type amino acid transport substrate-binding protein